MSSAEPPRAASFCCCKHVKILLHARRRKMRPVFWVLLHTSCDTQKTEDTHQSTPNMTPQVTNTEHDSPRNQLCVKRIWQSLGFPNRSMLCSLSYQWKARNRIYAKTTSKNRKCIRYRIFEDWMPKSSEPLPRQGSVMRLIVFCLGGGGGGP